MALSSKPSFNTQPPEGGWCRPLWQTSSQIGFNTQPPEGGWPAAHPRLQPFACFNTQPPEGGWNSLSPFSRIRRGFQHTAARRRLGCYYNRHISVCQVSTHSRPKAAGQDNFGQTAPAEFQHTAARRRLGLDKQTIGYRLRFQHTAARRRLVWEVKKSAEKKISFNTQPPEGGWIYFYFHFLFPPVFQHTAARRRLAACQMVW